MRILMIHASEFSFHVTEETSVAAAAGELTDDLRSGKSGDSLVCFVCVEKKDEDAPSRVVASATRKILAHQGKVNAGTLWVYPYAHLSSDLASPRHAQKALDLLWDGLEKSGQAPAMKRAPFGWYKAFDIKAKGHPLSENALTVTGDEVEATAGDEDAGESEAIKAEKKLRSKFYFVTPEGEEIPAEDFNLKKYPVLRRFHGYETAGTRVSAEEPPHVRLMRQHELVDYEPGSDAGNFRWYPKGQLMKSLMEERINQVMNEYGAMRVETPIMYDYLHPNLAKYLNRFPARQYVLKSEKKDYFLRFAACFGQYLIKHDAQISYRHLPMRLYELTHYSFRREQSGELAGLRRLRTFTMPDMHTLCGGIDQAKVEFARQFDLSQAWMDDMGLPYATAVRVVKSFYEENKEFVRGLAARVGTPILLEVWEERFFYFVMKFEFNFVDNHDKGAALSTVQIDVENCHQFQIEYTDEDGDKKNPLILHASISGAIERNLYALLEHQAALMKKGQKGSFPFWLSPTQIRFIPVSDSHVEKCAEFAAASPFRADVDDRDMSMGKKIKLAEQEWVPYIAVIGDREVAGGALTVRVRGEEDFHGTLDELNARMDALVGGKPRRPLNTPRLLGLRPVFVG
ncbi:MAG: threonine--tRNA ligase [bacterium]